MRIILPPEESAAKLCGAQKHKPDVNYRPTTNRISILCDGGMLTYQTLTGELVFIPDDQTPPEDDLIAHWFLVPEDYDEHRHIQSLRQILCLMERKTDVISSFTILPTTDCNARCWYCFEHGARRQSMDTETAVAAANYIARRCGGGNVKLHWFGGEPAYNIPAMDALVFRLRELGVAYTSDMISNGYYLDRSIAISAVEDWHLTRVQITLDGTQETYNRVKAYTDRGPDGRKERDAYSRVLENIGHCLNNDIAVWVRLNLDGRNTEDLLSLIEELSERFGGIAGFSVYAAVLREFSNRIYGFYTDAGEIDAFQTVSQRIRDLGLERAPELRRGIQIHGCMADSGEGEVILPDGGLSVCDQPRDEARFGNVIDGATDTVPRNFWKQAIEIAECVGCPLEPLCINLKNCPWVRDRCPPSMREMRIHYVRRALMGIYNGRKP